jgi:hypothetical protein
MDREREREESNEVMFNQKNICQNILIHICTWFVPSSCQMHDIGEHDRVNQVP